MSFESTNSKVDDLLDHYAQRFAWRAEHIYGNASTENASPLYAQLSAKVADDPEILSLVLDADKSTQVANLLFGAVHFLLLAGVKHPLADFYASLSATPHPPQEAYPYFRAFCLEQAEEIRRLVITQRVQTNEVQRCTALLPAFRLVADRVAEKSLALVEVGASAGLNLLWDRYGYDYGAAGQAGNIQSSVQLICGLQGDRHPAIPGPLPSVVQRVGIDIHPIDVGDENATRWLRALIWPEHTDRARLLLQALELARQNPPPLVGGNVVDVLPDVVANLPREATLCIYHSYTLNQCPQDIRDQVDNLFMALAKDRSFFRISLEWYAGQAQPQLELYHYQHDEVRQELLAFCESHGRWLEWLQA